MNKQQEPRLRFKGFTGAWKEQKIIEIAEYVDYRGKTPRKTEEGIFLITAKNVKMGSLDYKVSQEFIAIEDFESVMSRGKAEIGDVLITTEAPLGNVAQIDREDVALAQRIIKYRGIKGILNNDFLTQKFLTNTFQATLGSLSSGGTVQGIKGSLLHQIEIKYPSLPEQTHLGLFFSRLDSQIAESRAVLEKSRQLKKAMLAKMFPANGEKTPKIRFKGFEGEWECRKFSEVAELRRGLTYSPLDISPNGIRVLRSSNIDEENYIEKNDDVFVCERAVNIPLVQNGDILITAANGSSRLVGKHAIIQTSMPAVHGGFMLLAKTENPYFLNASMSSTWYLDFIRIFVAGGNGAIGNLSIGDLNEQEILIPKTLEEQTAIGNFFRQLDETIALQTAEVEKLNQLKKGLLAAMLV
ncbi:MULTISPECIES: restriction endonuclease subunit S [Neisseria]|uniref:Restriction endonuclease subunit S n=2 Tax=Neisseria TaxID=482 RepID=A0ABD7EVQ7_NEIPE|nr:MULTISPECIES: restriction endonuclease subunit S [Neisseria]QXW89808.1 restriction endonuclease subunit S [Neisseria perflava]QXW94917.1 restriction endonuclease subunit S [Neisseria sicca ATCC 29256]